MDELVVSKNGLPIRLPAERWAHITEEHRELEEMRREVLQAVSAPDRILAGSQGELLAVREVEPGKCLVVPYRELPSDGFVITAFLTKRTESLNRRRQVWPL
jgi:hypothetical protein